MYTLKEIKFAIKKHYVNAFLKEIRSRKFPSIREVLKNLYRLKTLVGGELYKCYSKL